MIRGAKFLEDRNIMVNNMCLFLVSGSKTGAGFDDTSISSDELLSLSPRTPRVHVRSTKRGGTVMSKFEVHVQIDSAYHILVFINRTRCGP